MIPACPSVHSTQAFEPWRTNGTLKNQNGTLDTLIKRATPIYNGHLFQASAKTEQVSSSFCALLCGPGVSFVWLFHCIHPYSKELTEVEYSGTAYK